MDKDSKTKPASHVAIAAGTLKECMRNYALAPLRCYTFLGTENSAHQLWDEKTRRYDKPIVEHNGVITGWFDPSEHLPWLAAAMRNGAYSLGLLDGYLPAVNYVYRQEGTRTTCEMTAFAADAPTPGEALVHVHLLERAGEEVSWERYFKLGSAEAGNQAEFATALQALRHHWEGFFAAGRQFRCDDQELLDACKASIVRAMVTFTGKRPHYGVRSYGPGTVYGIEQGDGFPPTIIALVDCLLDWGQEALACEYLAAYFEDFVRDDGRVKYYIDPEFDGCSVAEYGQFLWLANKCVAAGGKEAWLALLRPKLEAIRQWAWDAQCKAPGGLVAGAPEADMRKEQGVYFHNNAWLWRGLRDCALALGHPEDLERCERYRGAILDAVDKHTVHSVSPPFIPPMPLKFEPFAKMRLEPHAFVDINSYTNYRYWPELLSSGILRPEQMEAIVAYRKSHEGEIAGLTRIWEWADNWTMAEHAAGIHLLGWRDELIRLLLSHVAGHTTPETWTAYEQVSIESGSPRTFKADYCVPSQLVAPRLFAWLAEND